MELYRRKFVLIVLLLGCYLAVSFWVPYSKLWFIKDVMENQARLYFASQSAGALRELLIRKAEALDVALEEEDVTIQKINGEIIYIALKYNVPLDIFFYHTTLHFEPKIFGLIRGFGPGGQFSAKKEYDFEAALAELSDSTKRLLREKTLQTYFRRFFAK